MHLEARRYATLLVTLGAMAGGCAPSARSPDADAGATTNDGNVTHDATTSSGDDGGTQFMSMPSDDAGVSITDPMMDADLDATSLDDAATVTPDANATMDSGVPPTMVMPPPPGDAVPAFDSATDAHVRSLVAMGASMGNRHDVVAKIGDSITESGSFLQDCGFGWYDMAGNATLQAAVTYFSMEPLGDDRNSLDRASLCATAGWSADAALEGYPGACPLTDELDAIHPQWAIVMYGTNDLERVDVQTYAANMNQIVDIIEGRGTVTVLSTIPPREDGEPYASRVADWNDTIRSIAATRHLPLIDFWVALQPLPGYGIGSDGVHPNVYTDPTTPTTDSCFMTSDALEYGYNVRNFTALEMLGRLSTQY